MPARISARSLDPLAPAECCDCHQLSFLWLPENQAEYLRNQRQAYAAHNGGHGGAARPRSRRSYGSLSESAVPVEPEPASESVDDTNEVVSRSSAFPSSSAAAALAAARVLSAASRNG
jgi:hypothetical protein